MKCYARLIVIALGLGCLVGACSSTTGGTPLTQAQIQQNAATVLYWLQFAGCVGATLSEAAAPIVTVAGDAKGQQVLSATEASTGKVCTYTVPPSALPAPAAPGAPAVPVPVKS